MVFLMLKTRKTRGLSPSSFQKTRGLSPPRPRANASVFQTRLGDCPRHAPRANASVFQTQVDPGTVPAHKPPNSQGSDQVARLDLWLFFNGFTLLVYISPAFPQADSCSLP
jgi:hypothetical protein